MKISSISLIKEEQGLTKFNIQSLGNIVVLAGSNGSGKTRLLKLLESYIHTLKRGHNTCDFLIKISQMNDDDNSEPLTLETVSKIELVNYSHYDAQLQLPKGYTPYVISKARNLLRKYDYEETALNALLLLEDMSNGYSEEFKDKSEWKKFISNYANPLNLEITNEIGLGHVLLFNRNMDKAALSPGQQYLLRIAVACYCNENNDNIIFILDEPELHLHPKAQIDLVKILRDKFPNAQFWISTHSLALISFLTVYDKSSTVLYMNKGNTSLLRSNSAELLNGLIGSEDNSFAIRQLLATPDEYACNRFAVECYYKPDVSDTLKNNPQNDLLHMIFDEEGIVVDFGVGKCRFLEEISNDISKIDKSKIQYYAYDKYDTYASKAKHTMDIYGYFSQNYYNDIEKLIDKIGRQANYVLMVNVLHEIDPKDWINEFCNIKKLLKDNGKLIIVEREELTVGEAPYSNGFLMITQNGAEKLFGKNNCHYEIHPNPKKSHIVKHTIEKDGLDFTEEKMKECIQQIMEDSLNKIDELKQAKPNDDNETFKLGIRLAFYLHQFANATLIKKRFDN